MYNVFGVIVRFWRFARFRRYCSFSALLFVFDVIAPTLFLQLTGNNIPETELVDSEWLPYPAFGQFSAHGNKTEEQEFDFFAKHKDLVDN